MFGDFKANFKAYIVDLLGIKKGEALKNKK